MTEIQSNAAINVDAERKVVQLNEEMKELARELRTKEQSYQESAVKIELMEKRLESVKKQADVLAQLEADLVKSRKQERTYEEANEVLQKDLDSMEQELGKLRQNVASAEKQSEFARQSRWFFLLTSNSLLRWFGFFYDTRRFDYLRGKHRNRLPRRQDQLPPFSCPLPSLRELLSQVARSPRRSRRSPNLRITPYSSSHSRTSVRRRPCVAESISHYSQTFSSSCTIVRRSIKATPPRSRTHFGNS